jgi:hypothetical protein
MLQSIFQFLQMHSEQGRGRDLSRFAASFTLLLNF